MTHYELLSNTSSSKYPHKNGNLLTLYLSKYLELEESGVSMKGMKNEKSPNSNCLPPEFYKSMRMFDPNYFEMTQGTIIVRNIRDL